MTLEPEQNCVADGHDHHRAVTVTAAAVTGAAVTAAGGHRLCRHGAEVVLRREGRSSQLLLPAGWPQR